jgi:hypothetical protein
MKRLLIMALSHEERRLIIDGIRSERKGDVRAIMLSEMFELLEELLMGDLTIEQLRKLFIKPPLDEITKILKISRN